MSLKRSSLAVSGERVFTAVRCESVSNVLFLFLRTMDDSDPSEQQCQQLEEEDIESVDASPEESIELEAQRRSNDDCNGKVTAKILYDKSRALVEELKRSRRVHHELREALRVQKQNNQQQSISDGKVDKASQTNSVASIRFETMIRNINKYRSHQRVQTTDTSTQAVFKEISHTHSCLNWVAVAILFVLILQLIWLLAIMHEELEWQLEEDDYFDVFALPHYAHEDLFYY